jgi:ABC-type branched-subunit amino acid transport system ATPase component
VKDGNTVPQSENSECLPNSQIQRLGVKQIFNSAKVFKRMTLFGRETYDGHVFHRNVRSQPFQRFISDRSFVNLRIGDVIDSN